MAKRKSKLETTTNTIIKHSLERQYKGGFYTKIPDITPFGSNSYFNVQRPFDIIFYYQGMTLAIESKAIRDNGRFEFKSVKDHQVRELLSIAENNGNAYIAVHFFEARVINRIYFIDIYDFLYWSSTSNKKSVSRNEFNSSGYISFYRDVKSEKTENGSRKQFINLKGTYIIGW